MKDEHKTKEQLVNELVEMRQRVAELEAADTEHKRAEEEIRQRTAQLEALCQAGLHLTSTLDLQPTLEAILDYALQLVAAYDAHIFLYDGERLIFGAALWEDGHQQAPYAEPRPQGLTYTVARSGEPIVVPDVNSHSLFRDCQWGGAIVGLPLRVGERVVGVMTVAFERPHAFDKSELRVLGLLADQAAIAIENARLYEAAQREITERKRAEETLKEYSERMEEMVEERTLELQKAYSDLRDSQARLIQSEKLAATGRLAVSVAHEINNPLQGIGNYLAVISRQVAEDGPLHEDLEMVKLGFGRITEIVRRLRAFYRPIGEEMEPTDINGVVERVLALVGHQLSLGQVKVKTELAEQELPVLGSAGQLEQVLVNLALNAQEAMPGGGELTLRTTLRDDVVQLQVSDTGHGISEEEMSRLFQPFYSGRGGKGLGLGLWISHNIIEGHGGHIEVESQVGEGSTFTISLPACQRER